MPEPANNGKNSDCFIPPSPSRASRRPSLRSKGSHRGSLTSVGRSTFLYESDLEARVALVAGAHPGVLDVLDQPPAVAYRDARGASRVHTFDQLVSLKDGSRVLVEVKPHRKCGKAMAMAAAVAAQIQPHVATHVVVLTERDIPRDAVRDAKLFHAVRRDPPSDADRALRDLLGELNGAVTVGALVAASGLGAQAFRAVVRLVADGVLRKLDAKALSYSSPLTRAPRTAEGGAA